MKLPKSFHLSRSPDNTQACTTLKRDASRVLRRVACDLALRQRDYTIRSHRQRRRQADVVALHTDSLYLEIAHAPAEPAVSVRFRTCRGRNDLAGGRDNAVCLQSLGSPDGYAELLGTLRVLAGRRS